MPFDLIKRKMGKKTKEEKVQIRNVLDAFLFDLYRRNLYKGEPEAKKVVEDFLKKMNH